MSNDKDAVDPTLELDLPDGSATDPSADEANDPEKDEVAADLDLESDKEESEKAQKREEAVDKHARAYAAKIISKAKTLDDIPENHKYLIPKVKELLGMKDEAPKKEEKKSELSTKELVQYELRKEKLHTLDLEPQQIKSLNSRFKFLRSKGFGLVEALDEAIDFAKVDMAGTRKEFPKIKTGGAPASKVEFEGTEDPNKMSKAELAKLIRHNEQVAKG